MPPLGQIRIIGGKWRGRLIKVVAHPSLRPTSDRVRETLFNWLSQDVVHAQCLDLFAGTGALGFEALSRGASKVVFVEKHLDAFKMLQATAKNFDAENACEIIAADALTWLATQSSAPPFDIIFLDPPFSSTLLIESLDLLAKSPLIGEKTLLYIEAPKTFSSFPTQWEVLKQKSTREVNYHLLRGMSV